MDEIIRNAISEIILSHKDLMKIPLRQKAKFEGWLKFELALKLQQIGMNSVEVETKAKYGRSRTDITFWNNYNYYKIELKTPNTNWKINGIAQVGRPITKNINSIIDDALKLNSDDGIVAFVLFPIPLNDKSWEKYIHRIHNKTNIDLSVEKNCQQFEMNIDDVNRCKVVICAFKSKRLRATIFGE